MLNISPKIVETLFAIYPKPTEDDFDEIATTCIVGLQRNMADLNEFLLSTRGKKMTDKRREISTELIANLLFYIAILIHLNDLPPDVFDMSEDAEDEHSVVAMTAMFDETYFHSPLLLGNHLMGICTDIGEYMWSEKFNETGPEEIDEERSPFAATAETTSTISTASSDVEIPDETGYHEFMKNVIDSTQPMFEEDDVFFDLEGDIEAEAMITRLLAGLTIMADLCDIDLGVAMFNASQITEI